MKKQYYKIQSLNVAKHYVHTVNVKLLLIVIKHSKSNILKYKNNTFQLKKYSLPKQCTLEMLQKLQFQQCLENFFIWYHDKKKSGSKECKGIRSHPCMFRASLPAAEPARLIVLCCQTGLSPHQSLTNKILKQQSVLTKSSPLIHNYPCNSYYSFYHPLALIPIIPSRTVSTLLSLGISHTTRI